jgi:pimeloyl-ACP methyl ester carboxylesterase
MISQDKITKKYV